MTEITLNGNKLSTELLFFLSTIEPNEEFQLTGIQCAAAAAFVEHLINWAKSIEETIGTHRLQLALCMQGLADFFHLAHEADGITLDEEARHQLRITANGCYHLAKEAEGLAPFEMRFPDWRVPAECPANDQVAAL